MSPLCRLNVYCTCTIYGNACYTSAPLRYNGNSDLHSNKVCYEAVYLLYRSLTCNLNYHTLVEKSPVVVSSTYIHSSQRWLYTFEMENSLPNRNLECCVTSIVLHEHIIITCDFYLNNWYATVVVKSPLVSKQFANSAIAFSSAPNANCFISANQNWTSECRAILSS